MNDQLDLLDAIKGETRGTEKQEQLRFATVLTCMRDAMPNAMRFMIDLWAPPDKAWHGSGDWSYWWSAEKIAARPRLGTGDGEQTITWVELAELVEHHPYRQSILDWEQSLDDPKWKDLTRPEELHPYAYDYDPDFSFDRDRPGWDERLNAWLTMQSILTDAVTSAAPEAADFRLPKQQLRRPRGSCRFCREELVVGSFAEDINHHPMGNICTKQWLIRNHASYAHQQLEEARKDGRDTENLEAKYEHEAARATEAWHGDGWKTTL